MSRVYHSRPGYVKKGIEKMNNWGAYVMWRGYSKIINYLNSHNIRYNLWRDEEGGYEFEASVTPEQYNELEALFN